MKICHITTIHPRYDTRIFYKECVSLATKYETLLIVADGQGNEVKNKVQIIDIGLKNQNRIKRIFIDTNKAYKKAKKLNCQVYHLHDPELIPIGLKLKKSGAKIIFDAHEDLPKQIRSKPYLNKNIAKILSFVIRFFEKILMPKYSAIICATDTIQNKFLSINKNSYNINNYPILNELKVNNNWNKKTKICYIGGISEQRGIKELVDALNIVKTVKLDLAGNFIPQDLKDTVSKQAGWKYVNEYGFVNRDKVKEILAESFAGIVTLMPTPNILESLPIKMFEYMSASIPVIASNIPLWEKIINEANCGICVNPKNPKEIAKAVIYLKNNSNASKIMGENGRLAIEKKYNWKIEEKKLFMLYNKFENKK